MNTFYWKKWKCRNDKNEPLKNVHFPDRKLGTALECVVFSGPGCLVRMFIIPQRISGAARAALHFSLGEEQTFSECALCHRKKDEPPARGLRATWIWRREICMYRAEMNREDSFSVWWCMAVFSWCSHAVNDRVFSLLNRVKYDCSLISFSASWLVNSFFLLRII